MLIAKLISLRREGFLQGGGGEGGGRRRYPWEKLFRGRGVLVMNVSQAKLFRTIDMHCILKSTLWIS